MQFDILATIAANAHELTRKRFGPKAGISALIKAGVPNGNAQRLWKGQENYGLNTLLQVADALGVPAWKLCIPDLESGAHVEAWPLDPFVTRDQWAALTAAQRAAAAWEASKAIQTMASGSQIDASAGKPLRQARA